MLELRGIQDMGVLQLLQFPQLSQDLSTKLRVKKEDGNSKFLIHRNTRQKLYIRLKVSQFIGGVGVILS